MAWVSWSQLQLEFELQFVAVRTISRRRACSSQWPRVSSPAEWRRRAAIVRETWGQYVAVCSVSNSPLAHNPFATLSRIKCERYIFLKKCVRSSLFLIMFPHVYMYTYRCIMVIQQDNDEFLGNGKVRHLIKKKKPFICFKLPLDQCQKQKNMRGESMKELLNRSPSPRSCDDVKKLWLVAENLFY